MSENMRFYEKVRKVPPEALKPIQGGRLKGMSDINPMWRLKMLTELFGPCGIGWRIEIVDKRFEKGSGIEIVCFVDINLFIKVGDEWSHPIPGMGGSSFVTMEKNGPFTSDECFKMAYTDAIGGACKMLGVAADVYFEKDRTKYNQDEDREKASRTTSQGQQQRQQENTQQSQQEEPQAQQGPVAMVTKAQITYIGTLRTKFKVPDDEYRRLLAPKSSANELTIAEAKNVINQLQDYKPRAGAQ